MQEIEIPVTRLTFSDRCWDMWGLYVGWTCSPMDSIRTILYLYHNALKYQFVPLLGGCGKGT